MRFGTVWPCDLSQAYQGRAVHPGTGDFAGQNWTKPLRARALNTFSCRWRQGLDDIPALHLDQTSAQAVRQGRVLSDMPQSSGLYLAKTG